MPMMLYPGMTFSPPRYVNVRMLPPGTSAPLARFATEIRLYTLISIDVLNPARLTFQTGPFRSSIGA